MTEDIDSVRQRIATLDSSEQPVALADALADALAAGADADVYESQEHWLTRLKTLAEHHDTAPIRSALGRGLAAATTIEDCDERADQLTAAAIEQHRDRLAELHDADASPTLPERLAFATGQLLQAHANADRLDQVADEVHYLTRLYDRHPTEAIAAHLADGLVTDAGLQFDLDRGDSSRIHANYQFVESLAREYPGETLDERLAGALSYSARASYTRTQFDYGDAERKASRIEGLYRRYRSDELAYWLAHGTHPKVWAFGSREKFQAAETEIERVERLVDDHDHEKLPQILGWYYRNAVYSRVDADLPAEIERTLDRLAAFYESNVDREQIPNYYANALRSVANYYFEATDFEAAERKLDRIVDLYETHDPAATKVPNRYARALASGVEAHVDRDEIEAAMAYFDRIRELVDDGGDVGTPLTEATNALSERILAKQDSDELQEIVTDLWSVVEDPLDRFVAAELQTRLNLGRGHWWPEDGDYTVTVESETPSTVTVRVTDQYGLEHVITVGEDGEVSTTTGDGDIPADIDELSSFQQQLAQFVRGYAVYWVDTEHEFDVLAPHRKPGPIETVREAIGELSIDEIDDLFGEYLAQHASHAGEMVPFAEPTDRPVDPVGVDLDDEYVHYEVWVAVDDGSVSAVSDVQIAVIDGDDRTVVREAAVPDGETYARVSLPVRAVYTPALLRTVIDENLRCQRRDRYVAFGQEPPADSRLTGPGQHSVTAVYRNEDAIPNVHDVETTVPGYDAGLTDEQLLGTHIRNAVHRDVEWARDVHTAFEDVPMTCPEPPTIAATDDTRR